MSFQKNFDSAFLFSPIFAFNSMSVWLQNDNATGNVIKQWEKKRIDLSLITVRPCNLPPILKVTFVKFSLSDKNRK